MAFSRTTPRIQWQKHNRTIGLFDGLIGMSRRYYVLEQQGLWYWFDSSHRRSRPYIDREDAMRGAQRHHEERENG